MTAKQIIKQKGRPAFVVIPYDEWQRIEAALEDRADAAAVQAFLDNPTEGMPEDTVRAIVLDGIHPVKAVRRHRRMTQAALADAAGTSAVYVSQIERGKRQPGRKVLTRLARALRVPADVLDRAD